ncbi:hypothetical protein B0H11DRAFT_1843949 [Mycena galericulata]|nr:hypothetical protein B0H11DRAFT_1843949 [Mycena galericulata]
MHESRTDPIYSDLETGFKDTLLPAFRECPGIELSFPPGQNAHLSYPFGVHSKYRLPWGYRSEGDRFYLRSNSCKKSTNSPSSGACKKCAALLKDDFLVGIIDRISSGVKPDSTHIWFPIGGLIEKIRRDSDQINTLRLTKLSDARKLVAKIAELDLHKQLMMAIASGDVQRVVPLLQAGLKNGESVRALLERFYRACVDVYREGPTYSPKGFTPNDYMVGICVLRLGGARLADILHRALGLPGLTTLRKHAVIRPLRASPGVPTVQEIIENIDAYTDGEDVPVGPPQIIHRVVMLDEIAVERRARWDDKTNMILGACREHCANVPLEFGTMDDATQFFEAMDRGEVHLATEATVVAFGALSKDPQIYNPRPICISGTCKAETASEHAAFLRTVGTAAEKRRSHGNITYRTISYASDGEAKRGSAFVKEFMKYRLKDTSLIFPLLSPLLFMNLQVGPDDITPDKDYRHVIKTVRNLLMRKMGINLLGCLITPAVVKQHLRAAGLTKERIDSLLNPNDRQHVALGYQLLNELWSLRDPLPSDSPGFSRARRALQTFGKLGYYLVMPYICVTLSLREQLIHLSAAAHLLLILFTGNRAGTSFMANQTFVNVMLMVKNAFFCVAKAKVDIPDSEFFLILLGTNREEKLFGLIRTAVGPDSNVDIYQLNGRASNLTEVSKILALRPDWDRGPKRLHLPAIINANGEVSKKSDHVSPASWVGDVHVSTVGPHGCWKGGRKIAEGLVSEGADILKNCAKIPSFDILSPFGKPLVDVPDHPNAFEPDPELYRPSDSPADSNSAVTEPTNSNTSISNDTDIDDMIAIDESTRNNNKFSPHIISEGKKVSKATILSNLMQGRSARLSTDRTRRVAGITAFSNSSPSDLITLNGPLGTPSLRIGNPIATLVECEDRLFLAIGQVVNILFGAQATESIPISLLPDGGTKVSYQILRLSRASIEDDPSTVHNWRWSLSFESTFNDVPGALIHPLNPTISNRISGKPTYLFTSEELITLTATIFSQTPGRHRGIPIFQRTERFPYRYNGKACFLVDDGEWTRGEFKSNAFECPKCDPPIPLTSENHQKILEHNGAHILFDTSIENSDQPCGLCLRPFPTCTFELSKTVGSVAARQIDWRRSTCINPMKFKMAAAKKSTKHSPCTNHLLPCPMQCGQNIWTYNLDAHFRGSPHNLQMLDSVPRAYQMAPGEMEQMKKIWLSRHDLPKPRNLKKKSTPPLVISAAHSSSNALNDGSDWLQSDDEGSDGKMDSESEGYELEYLDEPSVNHLGPEPLGEADDDEIDQEIDHLVAPGIDYAHLNKSLELDHSERPPSMLPGSGANLAPKPRDSVQVETSATVLSIQDSLDVEMVSAAPLPPSETTTAVITQAGASKRTRVTLDRQKICDCGVEVTQEEKDDPKETIECSKAGCESTWYHRGCIGELDTVRKGWVCKPCGGGKRPRHRR